MCKGNDCSCLDEPCCSLRTKALVFSIWTLMFGCSAFMFTLLTILFEKYSYYPKILICFSLLHILGGLALLFGFLKHVAKLFLTGIIVSSILPFLLIIMIVPPAAQVIFIITGYRYYKNEMK